MNLLNKFRAWPGTTKVTTFNEQITAHMHIFTWFAAASNNNR